MRLGFLVTSPYQLYHYKWIAAEFEQVTALIEVREIDFRLTRDFVRQHLPNAEVQHVPESRLAELDGRYDALVCQTPILPLRFLQHTLVVAQQYSLAKEAYQYGTWRTHAHLNLMYGEYSVRQVGGFAHAVAVGNPMLDPLDVHRPDNTEPTDERRHAVYLPTYGELSSIPQVLPRFGGIDADFTLKVHHAQDLSFLGQLPRNVRVATADTDPIQLLRSADFAISDFSGAAFDAASARLPLLLTGDADPASDDLARLSAAERSHELLADLGVRWDGSSDQFETALASARARLEDPRHRAALDNLIVNPGRAGQACADEIRNLIESGEPVHEGRDHVRASTKRYITRNRELSATLRTTRSELATEARARSLAKAESAQLRRRLKQRAPWHPKEVRRLAKKLLLRVPGARQLAMLLYELAAPASDGARQQQLEAIATRSKVHAETPQLPEPDGFPAVMDTFPRAWQPPAHREAMLTLLKPYLAEHGVRVEREGAHRGEPLAVASHDRYHVLHALKAAAVQHTSLRVRLGAESKVYASVKAADLAFDQLYLAQWIEVGTPFEHRNFRLGASGYIQLLFVEYDPERCRYVALRQRADRVDWTDWFERGTGSIATTTSRANQDTIGQIDAVYTWVDDSDPQWRRHYQRFRPNSGRLNKSADNRERYVDREELRHSLRSLETYAPFFRHIYLVTSGHVPHWLDLDHERITIVSHAEIFPDTAAGLPTFNSHAIEACLHRIPGLSERFVYLNDDVFFGREVTKQDFFTKAGLPKVRLSPSQFIYEGRPPDGAIPTDFAAYNSVSLIERDFGIRFNRRLKHVPMPLLRSTLEELEQAYPDEFARTRLARFRSRTDIAVPSMLAQYYSIVTHRAVEWENIPNEYIYADTGRDDFAERLELVVDRRPRFFCLNVTRHTGVPLDEQATNVRSFLADRYPFAGSFERPHLSDTNARPGRESDATQRTWTIPSVAPDAEFVDVAAPAGDTAPHPVAKAPDAHR